MLFLIKKIESEQIAYRCIKIGLFGFGLMFVMRVLGHVIIIHNRSTLEGSFVIDRAQIGAITETLILLFCFAFIVITRKNNYWRFLLFFAFAFSPLFLSYQGILETGTPIGSALVWIFIAAICFQAVRGAHYFRTHRAGKAGNSTGDNGEN